VIQETRRCADREHHVRGTAFHNSDHNDPLCRSISSLHLFLSLLQRIISVLLALLLLLPGERPASPAD
jgi:hypothetical protein